MCVRIIPECHQPHPAAVHAQQHQLPPGPPASFMAACSWAQFRHPDPVLSCLWKTSYEEPNATEARYCQVPPENPLWPGVHTAERCGRVQAHRQGLLPGPGQGRGPRPGSDLLSHFFLGILRKGVVFWSWGIDKLGICKRASSEHVIQPLKGFQLYDPGDKGESCEQ